MTVNHSPPFISETKKEWICTPSPPIRLHIVDREDFTFLTFTMTHIPSQCV
jgi:hypothetical protein